MLDHMILTVDLFVLLSLFLFLLLFSTVEIHMEPLHLMQLAIDYLLTLILQMVLLQMVSTKMVSIKMVFGVVLSVVSVLLLAATLGEVSSVRHCDIGIG